MGHGWVRCLGLQLSGKTLDHVDALGQPLTDSTFLILFNPHWEPIGFYLPARQGEQAWRLLVDTRIFGDADPLIFDAGQPYKLISRSLALFEEVDARTPTIA